MKKEIVYTTQYALILSDGVIKEGDYFLTDDGRIEIDALDWKAREWHKKIIGHLPLSDSPILEGVPLLPPLPQVDDIKELAEENYPIGDCWNSEQSLIRKLAFKNGYNKAKEKYKYTEEDLEKVWLLAVENTLLKALNKDVEKNYYQLLESLQQPSRPTHFECGMLCGRCSAFDDECWSAKECTRGYDYPDIMRTTTNSQGQIELVGKYI